MIEKLLALVLVMTYVVWSLTAQKVIPTKKPTEEIAVIDKKHTIDVEWSQEKIHNAIIKAGEKNDWLMTEFKNNAIIAEKTGKNSTIATTITFDRSSFSLLPTNSELESAISAILH